MRRQILKRRDGECFWRTGPWTETRLCVELLKNGILNDPGKMKNPSTDCSCYEKKSSGGASGDCGNAPSVTVDSPGCTIRCGDTYILHHQLQDPCRSTRQKHSLRSAKRCSVSYADISVISYLNSMIFGTIVYIHPEYHSARRM